MSSLGTTLGNALNLSPDAAMTVGVWFARITGFLSMFPGLYRRVFTLSYSPLKPLVQYVKALWPAPMTTLNANGMPATAGGYWCVLVSLFILLVFGGCDTASAFYNKPTLDGERLNDLPYLFFALAFPSLKRVRSGGPFVPL